MKMDDGFRKVYVCKRTTALVSLYMADVWIRWHIISAIRVGRSGAAEVEDPCYTSVVGGPTQAPGKQAECYVGIGEERFFQ